MILTTYADVIFTAEPIFTSSLRPGMLQEVCGTEIPDALGQDTRAVPHCHRRGGGDSLFLLLELSELVRERDETQRKYAYFLTWTRVGVHPIDVGFCRYDI